jgi:peptide/nickel transport system substrate-binding protein
MRLAWVGLLLCLAARETGAQHLVIGGASPATVLDPHFSTAAPDSTIAMHVFDRLVERTPDSKFAPGLAVRWTKISETVWEFVLRTGVTWQDGRAFSADDVAFSLARAGNVPNALNSLAVYVRDITAVDVVEPLVIQVRTRAPTPDLPGALSNIAIVARHVAEGATTADFNSGRAEIGTGAYRLVQFAPGDKVELVRNDQWWGQPVAWDAVTYRAITNAGSRVAALLAGDVDIIDVVPPEDFLRLLAQGNVRVASIAGLRAIFLTLDALEAADPWVRDARGVVLAKNPLHDRRVRQALNIAINRAALAEHLMQGAAVPAGQLLPPGTFGHDPRVAPPGFDPQWARHLLVEAGYPGGFHLTVHTPNDRFLNDSTTMQAVAQMWTRIGVVTQVAALPWSTYASRGGRHEFAVGLWAWGNNTAEAGNSLLNVVGTVDQAGGRGTANDGRFSDPRLDGLISEALATMQDAAREKLLFKAVELAADDVAIIPLYHVINTWATRKTLIYDPRMDQRTLAMDAHPVR